MEEKLKEEQEEIIKQKKPKRQRASNQRERLLIEQKEQFEEFRKKKQMMQNLIQETGCDFEPSKRKNRSKKRQERVFREIANYSKNENPIITGRILFEKRVHKDNRNRSFTGTLRRFRQEYS